MNVDMLKIYRVYEVFELDLRFEFLLSYTSDSLISLVLILYYDILLIITFVDLGFKIRYINSTLQV